MRRAFLPAALVLLAGGTARAAGFDRPTGIGARASGMSGAFAAVATDTSAVYHNPAGLALQQRPELQAGLDLLFMVREYEPPSAAPEKASAGPTPLPYVFTGAAFQVTRRERMALGFGIYNSFGGTVDFPDRPITEGPVETLLGLYEFTPALAYRLDDKVQIGLAFRVGLGFFSATFGCGDLLSCNQGRTAAEFMTIDTLYGVGFGYTLGILLGPFRGVTVGAVYRSNLDVTVRGNKALRAAGMGYDVSLFLPFPQRFALGVAYRAHPKWLLAIQWDWTDNSRFQSLSLDTGALRLSRDLTETPCDWQDSHTLRLGVEYDPLAILQVRWGLSYDSRAIPLAHQRRDLMDGHKLGVDIGATVRVGRWKIEASVDVLMGNLATGFQTEESGPEALAPGRYPAGGIVTANLAATVAF